MSKQFLNFSYIEIDKQNFHSYKSAVAIDVIYIHKKCLTCVHMAKVIHGLLKWQTTSVIVHQESKNEICKSLQKTKFMSLLIKDD